MTVVATLFPSQSLQVIYNSHTENIHVVQFLIKLQILSSFHDLLNIWILKFPFFFSPTLERCPRDLLPALDSNLYGCIDLFTP